MLTIIIVVGRLYYILIVSNSWKVVKRIKRFLSNLSFCDVFKSFVLHSKAFLKPFNITL